MKLYLLWHHGEDGPEGLKATLDPSHVEKIAASGSGLVSACPCYTSLAI